MKEIQESSGAHVQIDDGGVTITGSSEAIELAREAVLQILTKFQASSSKARIDTVPGGGKKAKSNPLWGETRVKEKIGRSIPIDKH